MSRGRFTLLLLLAYLALLSCPVRGIALWFDEAWRIHSVDYDVAWSEFFSRWFVGPYPYPVSYPHMILLRCLRGIVPMPGLEILLRALHAAAAAGALLAIGRLARAAGCSETVARAAQVALAGHAFFGLHAPVIKENTFAALAALLWAARLVRRGRALESLQSVDAPLAWGLIAVSPLLSPLVLVGSGAALAVSLRAGSSLGTTSGRRVREVAVFALLAVPVLVYGALTSRAGTIMGDEIFRFMSAHGATISLERCRGIIFGGPQPPRAVLVAVHTAAGFSVTSFDPGLLRSWIPGAAAAFLVAATAIRDLVVRRDSASALAALFLFSPALAALLLYGFSGLAPARHVVWASPFYVLGMTAIWLREEVRSRLRVACFVCLVGLTAIQWFDVGRFLARSERWDDVIFERPAGGVEPDRDVFLHGTAWTYYVQEVERPELRKGVIPLGQSPATLLVAPGIPVPAFHVPEERTWDAARIEKFAGGALWCASWFEEDTVVLETISRHAFHGANRLETISDYPYFFYRWSADTRAAAALSRR